MNKIDNGRFPYYTFDTLVGFPDLLHFTSSGERREESNLGFVEEAVAEQVRDNRRALADAVGFDVHRLVVGAQVHSSKITIVEELHAGRGALSNDNRLRNTDALITSCKNICLMVMSADCVPVLLYDPVLKVIAAIHAGWRGTADGVVAATLRMMMLWFECNPVDIVAGIGPSIGKCCFEVGEEVAEIFIKKGTSGSDIITATSPGKYNIDLWEINRRQLISVGVRPENIEVAHLCTQCHPRELFSYRHDSGITGRMGTGIMMK